MGDGKSDADLVREALSGRVGAYALLVHRWSARVLAVCHGRVGNASTAEDLAQETLLRALRALGSIRDPERFGSWICGIATRTCLDWLKSKQRTEVSIDFVEEAASEVPTLGTSSNESWDQLHQEIEQLPAECREVLILYYYSDSTYQELADMLNVSAATINARLTKARKLLRYRLSEAES
ncbi:MAG: RNA polymerase sigma factor [Phycisphaerae bacterium]|nr:MAG: RNA polymerase sigma factor [Phycisphaerae bacterium]